VRNAVVDPVSDIRIDLLGVEPVDATTRQRRSEIFLIAEPVQNDT
jgi:hypothetical protein